MTSRPIAPLGRIASVIPQNAINFRVSHASFIIPWPFPGTTCTSATHPGFLARANAAVAVTAAAVVTSSNSPAVSVNGVGARASLGNRSRHASSSPRARFPESTSGSSAAHTTAHPPSLRSPTRRSAVSSATTPPSENPKRCTRSGRHRRPNAPPTCVAPPELLLLLTGANASISDATRWTTASNDSTRRSVGVSSPVTASTTTSSGLISSYVASSVSANHSLPPSVNGTSRGPRSASAAVHGSFMARASDANGRSESPRPCRSTMRLSSWPSELGT
mmetsp:Transcript_14879/g.53531  ORF Transcript_14879/g.53531 Transcript_14879/m.53531 type:complete len:277 (-) Transcript_14879:277-1107(-)